MKILVAYFSAEYGATAKVARELAAEKGADLFEICPEKPYTRADLHWPKPLARCNREHRAGNDVPVAGAVALVFISMALTFIAGLIPSGIAARKDPVIALRTE